MMSALISKARNAAAESVVKYGLPVPAAKITTRPFSKCRTARRLINDSASCGISTAESTRVSTALQTFTHLIASKSADCNTLARLGSLFGDQLANRLSRVFNEWLIDEHGFFVVLIHATVDNFVDYLIGFACILRIILGLGSRNLSFLIEHTGGYLVSGDEARLSCCDVHCDIFNETLKLVATSDEVSLAIHFNKHADFSAHVNIRTDDAFSCYSAFALFSRGKTTFPQNVDSFVFVSSGLNECILALHHAGFGFFSKLLHGSRSNFRHNPLFLRIVSNCFLSEPVPIKVRALNLSQ